MSARKKSISRTRTPAKSSRHQGVVKRTSIAELRAEIEYLGEGLEHWRKRYFLRHEEAQKLEGLLSLRDAQIVALELDLKKKKAYIDKLEKKLLGPTSEQGPIESGSNPDTAEDVPTSGDAAPPSSEKSVKPKRGKRPGSPGFGPKNHESLPIGDEVVYDVDEACCSDCGEQWKALSDEETDEVEVEVRAYRRRHRRKKYGHVCKAKNKWVTKRAEVPRRLFPHSKYGISFWVFLLNGKFSLHVPINRLCTLLQQKGLTVSQGTIVAGFTRLLKLIKPLIAEIKRYSREEKSHWHIDDTGWKTFAKVEGKENFGWHLWVFKSNDVCVYINSPSRARAVPKSHLENSCGVVSCDRLAANKKLGDSLRYAFCWVHERRHLRQLHSSYPELRPVCDEFLNLIGSLFHWNRQRLLYEDASVEQQKAQSALSDILTTILDRAEELLGDTNIHSELRRVLKGIKNDWEGLYTFFDLPAIPPDNNAAEQAIRGAVVGRKGYYGSGSTKSAELAAGMFSLDMTLRLNGTTLEAFLTNYLKDCAANGGKPPSDAAKYLPWHRKPPPAD
jgi:transposase